MLSFFLIFLWGLGLAMSVILGLSATNLFVCWASLELNMLVFLVLLSMSKFRGELPMMKYFVVQGLSSAVFLLALALTSAGLSQGSILEGAGIAMLLKLGAAPFHSWYVSFISLVDWEGVFLASTLQKVLPFYVLQLLQFNWNELVIILCVLVGVTGSVSQIFLKKMIGYSSVFGVAWLLSSGGVFPPFFQFLGAYAWSLLALLSAMAHKGSNWAFSSAWKDSSVESSHLLFLSLLSLGGLPPFIGFYVKLMIVSSLITQGGIGLAGLLVVASGWILYLYLRAYLSMGMGSASGGMSLVSEAPKVYMTVWLLGIGLVGWLFLCFSV